jgi:hypothetical protein
MRISRSGSQDLAGLLLGAEVFAVTVAAVGGTGAQSAGGGDRGFRAVGEI